MTTVEIYTLAWPDTDPRMIQAHTDVCKHLGVEVNYHIQKLPHGAWMNHIMDSSKADIVGFLDIDCIPLNKAVVDEAIEYCVKNKTFVGIAQASNHISPKSHIFAAPAFFFMWRETWEKLDKPTFSETPNADVAENVSYSAELADMRYKTLYPTCYTKDPDEGAWHLHTYGKYGIGTFFEGGVFHLYQARMNNNVDLFLDVANNVLNNVDQYFYELKPCR